MSAEKVAVIAKSLVQYPDFPKKGIQFFDIFGVLRDVAATAALRDVLVERARELSPAPHVVVGLDARGFLFGPLLALELGVPFVPIRKRGKLPGAVKSASYALEYGEAVFEIQEGSMLPGQRALIVDDLLATGGTMGAACRLVEDLGASVVACLVVIELKQLQGRDKVPAPVISVVEQ